MSNPSIPSTPQPATVSTSAGLTPQDVVTLTGYFDAEDHEFRAGSYSEKTKKYMYLTYIGEEAIITRLNGVDPCWSLHVDRVETRDGYFSAYGSLTVKGVTRHGVGTWAISKKQPTAENAEKGAATDLLKRTARLFGIGVYLKRSDSIWLSEDIKPWDIEKHAVPVLQRWLAKVNPATQPAPVRPVSTPPQQSTPPPAGDAATRGESAQDDPVDVARFDALINAHNLGDAARERMFECHGTHDVRHLTRNQAYAIYAYCYDEAYPAHEDLDDLEDTKSPDEEPPTGKAPRP